MVHDIANACILSVQMISNGQRGEIVLRMSQPTAPDKNVACNDLYSAWVGAGRSSLLDCLSSDTEITGEAVVGASVGYIPVQVAHAVGLFVGTRAAGPAPTQVGALMSFLPDAADLHLNRVRVAKNTIFGIATADVSGDTLVAGLITNVDILANALRVGINGTVASYEWKRVVGQSPSDPSKNMIAAHHYARAWFGTQRRRLLPH